LFSDDFEAGFDRDTWEIVSGSPFVVGGRLTSNDGMMAIVDVGWPNYTISFDVGNIGCRPLAADSEDWVILIVRYVNRDNYLSMAAGCYRRWAIVSNGIATILQHTSFAMPPQREGLWHIEATVQGDQFTAEEAPTVFLDNVESTTRVGIQADGGVTIDNFSVISLP